MKRQLSVLALCLGSLGLVQAQTTTNSYSTPTTGTTTYSTTPTTPSDSSNGTTTNTGTTTPTNSYNSNGTSSTYGTTTTPAMQNNYDDNAKPERIKATDYKNFVFGIYAGLNTTKFKGEALDANGSGNSKLTGRLGYQAGFFVRGGGRLFGQIGAEYFASSSNYFTAGSGQSAAGIRDQIDIKYIQVPVYIGYKLTESDRGISAVRVQLGVEYANRIGSDANQFGNLNNFEIKSGTFNGLGQLGFDAGPVFLDLTYHYGFSNAINQDAGFAGSQRRILSASVGFKF